MHNYNIASWSSVKTSHASKQYENVAKRQVKAPKIYLADSGILHALLGLETLPDLLGRSQTGFRLVDPGYQADTRAAGQPPGTRGGPEVTGEGEEKGGPPAAGRTGERHQLARFDVEVDVAEHPTAPGPQSESTCREHGHGSPPSFCTD